MNDKDLVSDSAPIILINPPPSNSKCYICSVNAKLFKTFREELPDCYGASWECRDCLQIEDALWEIDTEKQLGRKLTNAERIQIREQLQLP